MREHNFASISNTSIHEAYPGHHLQLDAARRNGSLTRLLADAPEFTEGWGMYSELMMREHGFDDGRAFRAGHAHRRDLAGLPDHPRRPDAPRRAVSVEEATDFLVEHTQLRAAERARPRSSGTPTARPTRCPTCSAGRCSSALRADEQRRLGDGFSLKAFHDTLLRNGSLPISFHRRLLASRGLTAAVQVIPAIDLEAGPVAGRLLARRRRRASARRPTGPSASPSGSWRSARG